MSKRSRRRGPPAAGRASGTARRDQPSSRAARAQRGPQPRSGVDPRVIVAGIAALAIVVAAFVLAGGLGGNASPTPGPAASRLTSNCPTSQPAPLAAGETRTVTITTPKGSIVVKVHGSWSPIAAGNFVALASCGFYNGVVFHRTASLQDGTPFVIQGGAPNRNGSGGPGYTIADEPVTQTYRRGTVAMARTQGQADSQGSQFFIVLDDRDASVLASANTYAIFGEVTSGMDVADAIYQASGGQEFPSNPVPMTTVTVANP